MDREYIIVGPNGQELTIIGPEGATREQLKAAAKRAFSRQTQEAPADPTGSFGDNLLAATGSGMSSVVRALGGGGLLERFGLPGTKEEADRLNAPLNDTVGGKVGNVIGFAAPAALAVPFTPATLPGMMAAGAITGGAMTEGGAGERTIGAAGGALGGAVARALPAAYRAGRGMVRGLVEPFTDAGRQRIAGRAIQRFATQPIGNVSGASSITGARPMLAEATRDPGLATLQRAIGTADPEASALFAARAAENNAARVNALRALTGEPGQPASRVGALNRIAMGQPTREAAEGARGVAAARSYGEANAQGINQEMAAAMRPQIENLMARPSVQDAMAAARRLAAEDSVELTDFGSVQGMHYLKQALDDQVAGLASQPTQRRLVAQTASDLSNLLEEIAPAYQVARREFQMNSIPVNRAAVGERLRDTTTAAMRDLGGNPRLQANAFSRALNDEGRLIQQATGFRGGPQNLDDILTATQMGRVNAIRDELETVANLAAAANGPGSQTAKMLASQNLLRQMAGPMGMPEGWIESVLSQTLMRPVQFGMRAAEPRIGANIAEAMLDPTRANALIQAANAFDAVPAQSAISRLLQRSSPAMLGVATGQAVR